MSSTSRRAAMRPAAIFNPKRRKTNCPTKGNPFTLAKRSSDSSKRGVVEKLSTLRAVTQVEDEEYLVSLLKSASYNVESGVRLHFEDGFYERYQEEKKAGNSKDKSESNSYPRLLRKVTTLVESTTSLSAEETKSFFCQNNAEAYKVTAEGSRKVRISRKSNGKLVTFGRLPRELGNALAPLILDGFVTLSADVGFVPESLEILTQIPFHLTIWLENEKIFGYFQKPEKTREAKTAQAFYSLVRQLFAVELEQRQALDNNFTAQKQKAEETCDTQSTPEGLTCELYAHQLAALRWMLRREQASDAFSANSSLWKRVGYGTNAQLSLYVNLHMRQCSDKEPKNKSVCRGGILADEMGLGKTVSVISLLLASRPEGSDRSNPFCTTSKELTLIVCPASLLGQWRRELVGKVKNSHKLSHLVYHGTSSRCNSLGEYEVVITSYGQVSAELSSPSSRIFKTKWSRVVLDEGHLIKNAKTNLSKACSQLRADRKWILTGTPIQNSLEDLYSFFKFFQLEPWCSAHYWAEAIAKPFETGDKKRILAKLHALLNMEQCPLMLRRKKSHLGVLDTSKKHVEVVKVTLATGERELYENVFQRSKVEFESYFKTGKAKEKYAAIFTLLLRLRQACNHPLLVVKSLDEEDKENVSQNISMGTNSEQSLDQSSVFTRRILEEWTQERSQAEKECPICLEETQDPVMMSCAHVVCKHCLESYTKKFPESGCPVCRSPIDTSSFLNLDQLSKQKRLDAYRSKTNFKSSSKMAWLMRSLDEIWRVNSKDQTDKAIVGKYTFGKDDDVEAKPIKVVIFSQWTSFLSMVEAHLKRNGKKAVRLDGSMSSQARETAIDRFHTDRKTCIFLISLRAGSLGLNLTVASVMYILDPWFNPTVEAQAINRCHRLGQTRPVHVYRLVVENSVEERMLELQVQKASMAKTVLEEGVDEDEDLDFAKKKILSFEELASFFK